MIGSEANALLQNRPSAVERATLRSIKVVHTMAWAIFAGCILAIPMVSRRGEHRLAAWLAAIVAGEVLILAFNHWHCPLTAMAARHTADRRDNFDIYLPVWLAKYNKQIFGTLYVAGMAYALTRWLQ
jgi:hypothetical protein